MFGVPPGYCFVCARPGIHAGWVGIACPYRPARLGELLDVWIDPIATNASSVQAPRCTIRSARSTAAGCQRRRHTSIIGLIPSFALALARVHRQLASDPASVPRILQASRGRKSPGGAPRQTICSTGSAMSHSRNEPVRFPISIALAVRGMARNISSTTTNATNQCWPLLRRRTHAGLFSVFSVTPWCTQ